MTNDDDDAINKMFVLWLIFKFSSFIYESYSIKRAEADPGSGSTPYLPRF